MIKKVYGIFGILACGLVALVLWYFGLPIEDQMMDAIKFKNEYEAYNDKIIDNDTKYVSVLINKDNKIKYLDFKELDSFVKEKKGIIYFGSKTNNNNRMIVSTIVDVVGESDEEYLYYYEIVDESDEELVLNFINSKVTKKYSKLINPTLISVEGGSIVDTYSYDSNGESINSVLINNIKLKVNDMINALNKEKSTCNDKC